MVHYAIVDEGPGVSPLCGGWGDSGNWTLVRESVSCPRCLRRINAHEQALRAAPVSDRPATRRWTPTPAVVRSSCGRTTH